MTTSTSTVIAPGTYRIDPARSAVRLAVRELFGLVTVGGTVTIRDGRIVVTPDPTRSQVDATLDAASFQSGNRRRDADVTSKRFLNAAAYPDMTFTSTGMAQDGDGAWRLTGMLTVHGVSRQVSMPITASAAPGGCWFDGTATVDRYAFGVTSGKGIVARTVEVTLRIHAVPAG